MAKVSKSNRPSGSKPVAKPAAARRAARARSAAPALPGIEIIRFCALAVVCAIIWCIVYGRLSGDSWNTPIEYGLNPELADVKFGLAQFKAAQDGNYFPGAFHNIPQLGAPYDGNWNDFPQSEDWLVWCTGLLARVPGVGLFAAANFLVMAVQVLAALAFYYTARRFKAGWQWAFVGALFFGLAPFGFAHSLHHYVVTAYWHMGLALLVCFWLSNGNGLQFKTRDYWIAVAVAVITGWENVYYTNIFVQMMGIALIIQWVRHGWRAALPALGIGCVAFAAFLLINLHTLFYAFLNGHNPSAAARVYYHLEFYGFKLVDCFMPFPNHRIPMFAELGKRFAQWTMLPAETPPACYFGVVGILSFLWLAVYTVWAAIGRERRRIPLEATLVLWVFLYATVGGINGIVGMFKFELFRSTTRYCIVILGISLLFAVRRISLLARRWPSPWPAVTPLAIAVIGLWEYLPPTAGENSGIVAQVVNSDRAFAQEMEHALPKGGMVFQLPVMDYPEAPMLLPAYDHFRPYFFTHDLRYSFGSDKGRVRDAWQHFIASMPPAQQISTLERFGFSGIYINSAAYPDHAEAMLAQFKGAGRDQVIQSPLKDLYCVVLHPSANPELPPLMPLFAAGWFPEQDSPDGQRQNWATGNASIVLTNQGSQPVDKYATFYIASISPRTVTAQGDGAYQSWHLDAQHPVRVTNLRITLPPGESRLTLTSEEPPVRGQIGMMTFGIINFRLTDSPVSEQQ